GLGGHFPTARGRQSLAGVVRSRRRSGSAGRRGRSPFSVGFRQTVGRTCGMVRADRDEHARAITTGIPRVGKGHVSKNHEVVSMGYSFIVRRRSALAITETELKLIAALATIGLRSHPKTGYSTPAAMGIPSEL